MENIGFIGLGIMGKPMAKNLISAGYPLTVHDLVQSSVGELVEAGAESADTPKEVAGRSEVVITMLPDTPDVEKVTLGTEDKPGVLAGLEEGSRLIDMSTISASRTREMASAAAEKGVAMLDAPVSGGPEGAIGARLSIMVGGDEDVFKESLPIFEAMGKNIVYMGESGMGQTTKACNQVMCVLNILGMCEGLILGAKAGLDPQKLLDALGGGLAGSAILSNMAPKILKGDFEPGFMVRLQRKDLRLALEMADEVGVPLAGTRLVNQIFGSLEAEGLGDKGTQSLFTVLEKLAAWKLGSG